MPVSECDTRLGATEDLELRVVVSHLIWVLGTELRFSEEPCKLTHRVPLQPELDNLLWMWEQILYR